MQCFDPAVPLNPDADLGSPTWISCAGCGVRVWNGSSERDTHQAFHDRIEPKASTSGVTVTAGVKA